MTRSALKALRQGSVHRTPPASNVYSLANEIGRAKLLLFPIRIEGMSRITREARMVGAVPVVFDTVNSHVADEDYGQGTLFAASTTGVAAEIERPLGDGAELSNRSRAGMEFVRKQIY
ncbi:MAG: hypothetical protein HKL82_04305 [Acidimicrobiaceae bacterium]|nr:hypothetical protein [Acidimicrobiaceae bacterium]